MSDMHDLLERKARRFRPDDDGLERLVRRADRRRRGQRITSAAVALTVAVVGGFGAYSMLNRPGTAPLTDAGPTSYHAIWPHPDYEDAVIVQERANAGDNGVIWEQQANEVVMQFALNALGWVGVSAVPLPPADVMGNGPVTTTIRGCPEEDVNTDTDVLYCPDEELRDGEVTIERLLQPDPKGIWSVTVATVDGQPVEVEAEPVPGPGESGLTDPQVDDLASEVRETATKFIDARREGSENAQVHLSDAARNAYETHEGGLELFGYATGDGVNWVMDAERIPGTDHWRIVLRIHGSGDVIEETLRVGSPGQGAAILILEAERTD